jgi:prepilin-type N-terminal cleavage/methylation domain-containing protein
MTNIASLIRRARARLAQDQAGFTLPELLIAVLIVGLVSGAVATSFLVSSKATADGKTRLDESHDTQQAAAYFTADAANASYFRPTTPPPSVGASCQDYTYGGATGVNIGLFEWVDGGVTKTALYGIPAGPDKLMVRRFCENGTMVSEVKLTRHIGSTNPVVTCDAPVAPFTTCNQESEYLELSVQEKTGYDYTLRADPRPTATTPGGLLGNYALYIGPGGLGLGGNSIVDIQTDGIAVTEGPASCNGNGSYVTPPEALYSESPPPSPNPCTAAAGAAPADPMAGIAEPVVQPATATPTNDNNNPPNPPNSTLCGSTQRTYQPGTYDAAGYDHLKDACLASGIYYFTNGARLTNVRSAPGGVLIFVADGGLRLEAATLTAMSTGPQAGITIFMGRTNNYSGGNSSTEDGQMYSNGAADVGGIVYGPAHPDGVSGGAKLQIQSNNGALTAKAINFYQMEIQGNGVGAIIN